MQKSAAQADEDHGTSHVEPNFADRVLESLSSKGSRGEARHAHEHEPDRAQSDQLQKSQSRFGQAAAFCAVGDLVGMKCQPAHGSIIT